MNKIKNMNRKMAVYSLFSVAILAFMLITYVQFSGESAWNNFLASTSNSSYNEKNPKCGSAVSGTKAQPTGKEACYIGSIKNMTSNSFYKNNTITPSESQPNNTVTQKLMCNGWTWSCAYNSKEVSCRAENTSLRFGGLSFSNDTCVCLPSDNPNGECLMKDYRD